MAVVLRSLLRAGEMRGIRSAIALTQHSNQVGGPNIRRRLLHFTSRTRSQAEHDHHLRDMHPTSERDKQVLVWTKKYPSIEQVPKYVTQAEMKKARDYLRIRINIGMIFATAAGCVLMIIWGRHSRDAGDSLAKRGAEYEAKLREQGRREREAAAAAANKS